MHRDHLKGAAGFPSDDGCYAHSSLVPTSHPGPPAKPPPAGFPQSPALPAPPGPWQGQAPAQPDQVPRFLHSYPWPTRLARQEAETTLHLARRRRGLGAPGPGHPGAARPLSPPAALLFGKWGLHLVALYLVYGELRVPSIASGEVKAGRAFPSWPCGFSWPCPPGGGRPFVFGWWPTPPSAPSASSRGHGGWAWRRWWGCGGIGGRGRVSAS